jgi:hypothetical protein
LKAQILANNNETAKVKLSLSQEIKNATDNLEQLRSAFEKLEKQSFTKEWTENKIEQ